MSHAEDLAAQRDKARQFVSRWRGARREAADAKSFWDEIFTVFGLYRRQLAQMEYRTTAGFADLFWPGKLIVEHKSLGHDLDAAFRQAKAYSDALRNEEKPKTIITCDFSRFHKYEMQDNGDYILEDEFNLDDLPLNIERFGCFTGVKQPPVLPLDPLNFAVTEHLGKLFDTLAKNHYPTRDLPELLVRLVFCMFAEHTGLFERDQFSQFILQQTRGDGSDFGGQITQLFSILNTDYDNRSAFISKPLVDFPYVNGRMFERQLAPVPVNSAIRDTILECSRAYWRRVSPAIFGALFQCVMDPEKRANLGEHYTSERNILRILGPLFLDDLKVQLKIALQKAGTQRKNALNDFRRRVGRISVFDPACGCGNFLVVAFRELRELDIQAIVALNTAGERVQQVLDIQMLGGVSIETMLGLEIEEFPSQIAKMALWMIDHLMNVRLSEALGRHFIRLPINVLANVTQANALRTDWNTMIQRGMETYIIGNPPFRGSSKQSVKQKADMAHVFGSNVSTGNLDLVAAWFYKAAEVMQDDNVKTALVATNSITRGEQLPILWNAIRSIPSPDELAAKLQIGFAYESFKWSNDAPNAAQVHVVIIGFYRNVSTRRICCVESGADIWRNTQCISPYIFDYDDTVIINHTRKPLSAVPKMQCGSKPADGSKDSVGGNLIIQDAAAYQALLQSVAPMSPLRARLEACIKPYVGADEFLYGHKRWCLWMTSDDFQILRQIPAVRDRVARTKAMREKSTAVPTQRAAETPWKFFHVSQPTRDFIVFPEVTTETREYVPIGKLSRDIIVSNKMYYIDCDDDFMFGILSSKMHYAWLKYVGGRLENRFQYAATTVYNTFPFPKEVTEQQKDAVVSGAHAVIAARGTDDVPLEAKYDPLAMSTELRNAHRILDRAIDSCYGQRPFADNEQRAKFLFDRYRDRSAPLLIPKTKSRKK